MIIKKTDLESTYKNIRPYIYRTPVMISSEINNYAECNIFLNAKTFKEPALSKSEVP